MEIYIQNRQSTGLVHQFSCKFYFKLRHSPLFWDILYISHSLHVRLYFIPLSLKSSITVISILLNLLIQLASVQRSASQSSIHPHTLNTPICHSISLFLCLSISHALSLSFDQTHYFTLHSFLINTVNIYKVKIYLLRYK